jgi:hypothetical protein
MIAFRGYRHSAHAQRDPICVGAQVDVMSTHLNAEQQCFQQNSYMRILIYKIVATCMSLGSYGRQMKVEGNDISSIGAEVCISGES